MPVGNYPWVAHRADVIYNALHDFVGPDGYTLSDRVWAADEVTRHKIDELLAHHIRSGTSAVDIAKELEEFLQRERVGIRTRRPYGRWGSFEARRLARTEITAALGRGVIAAADANPFVIGIEWALSPNRTGDWPCNCPDRAEDDVGLGPGVYPKDGVPPYPDHPHCMCTLRPTVASTEVVVEDIRAWLNGEASEQEYDGLFDLTAISFDALWGGK